MVGKLLAQLRQQWMGGLALFLVLTSGGAYALAGHNTVFSDDIVNGEVTGKDVANGTFVGANGTSAHVDRVFFADVVHSPPLTPTEIFSGGGLKLAAQCVLDDTGGLLRARLILDAHTATNNASIRTEWLKYGDSTPHLTLDSDFDTGDDYKPLVTDLVVSSGGTLSYASTSGNVVGVTFQADENVSSGGPLGGKNCFFGGVATTTAP